jgi:energy-coupling factor transporter ATP-binding protein EcfA2
MVFQNPEAQLFNQTVEKEIAFGLESLGLARREIKLRIDEAAAVAGIEMLLPRNPHELSGGEQQLVSIAAVLALRPQTIILDEPYANLDPANVVRVRTALKRIHQHGTGIIISEHRLALTVADAQRMVVLHEGRIVLDGSPAEVLKHDIESYGLELPLAVSIGRQLGLEPLPLEIEDLMARVSADQLRPLMPPPLQPPAQTRDGDCVLTLDGITFQISGKPILRISDLP